VSTDSDLDALSLEFEITAVGTTISWLFQASNDPVEVTDANSDWHSLEVLPDDAATELATVQTKTAVGVYGASVDLKRRPVTKVRLVTSANTGCTYEAEAYGYVDDE
jgi:hypothetical protein